MAVLRMVLYFFSLLSRSRTETAGAGQQGREGHHPALTGTRLRVRGLSAYSIGRVPLAAPLAARAGSRQTRFQLHFSHPVSTSPILLYRGDHVRMVLNPSAFQRTNLV